MTGAVKIAIAGTHSTGKTTFLTHLRTALESQGYTVATVADLGEAAADQGFPILYHHTPRSTLWIMARGISLELEPELAAATDSLKLRIPRKPLTWPPGNQTPASFRAHRHERTR